ncbi:hypothetical protein [Desulfoluna spongiiphila]|uniref:hypothetical protein n=1 Tax=Desulfoluna spongiiphila TaxID=419481 RepID=UPI001587E039|nr:hypothetical protein [Desulfoluna spongiiphila]
MGGRDKKEEGQAENDAFDHGGCPFGEGGLFVIIQRKIDVGGPAGGMLQGFTGTIGFVNAVLRYTSMRLIMLSF